MQDSESIDFLKTHQKIGDIIEVQVAADFDYKIDILKPRPIVLISIPDTKLNPVL